MNAMVSQITASRLFTQLFVQAQIKEDILLAFVRGIHRPPHKGPVMHNAENDSI